MENEQVDDELELDEYRDVENQVMIKHMKK